MGVRARPAALVKQDCNGYGIDVECKRSEISLEGLGGSRSLLSAIIESRIAPGLYAFIQTLDARLHFSPKEWEGERLKCG